MSDDNQRKQLSHSNAVFIRLLEEYKKRKLNSAGEAFYCTKVKIFLLGYLITLLLGQRDRAGGRKTAQQLMAQLKDTLPQAYAMAYKQYRVFVLLNRLHIRKGTWDRLMDSKLYHRLKGNHTFK